MPASGIVCITLKQVDRSSDKFRPRMPIICFRMSAAELSFASEITDTMQSPQLATLTIRFIWRMQSVGTSWNRSDAETKLRFWPRHCETSACLSPEISLSHWLWKHRCYPNAGTARCCQPMRPKQNQPSRLKYRFANYLLTVRRTPIERLNGKSRSNLVEKRAQNSSALCSTSSFRRLFIASPISIYSVLKWRESSTKSPPPYPRLIQTSNGARRLAFG